MRAYWRYFLYVVDHKLNVCIECWKEGLYLQGIVHDFSKFSPKEFVPYARKFYSTRKSEETELQWKYAWLNHQHKNKHHWEYWVVNPNSNEVLPMPEKYIIEMVCDWRSFSRKWGRLIKDPDHLTNKMMASSGLVLHPKTRQRLEEITNGSKN
ncbi:DUF5662 family protein [Paenibacillus sp. EC2-1]|uniref:DUF5662 family protein n=1 Tax=Paenibacillus sp. EC2-1 TaxID=3388665 RepID=UPI003BEEEDDB